MTRILITILLSAVVVRAQDAGMLRSSPPDAAHNVASLYKRASASEFVAIGTVTKTQTVKSRKTIAQLDQIRQTGNAPPDFNPTGKIGILYTISVEQVLCRKADFAASPPQTIPEPSEVLMFIPLNDGMLYSERAKLNETDLLFLTVPAEQKQWKEDYDLDRSQTYYRATWNSAGVVSLSEPGPDPPILDKITQLCQAVQSADPAQKIAALDKLAASGDPVLAKEAEEAKKGMQAK